VAFIRKFKNRVNVKNWATKSLSYCTY
jgi:hypothetical protein